MASKSWLSPRSLLVLAGIVLLGLLVWRFSNIVAYILIASVLSLIARPLVHLLGRIRIGKWRIPVSLRALVTLLTIWVVFFSFFKIFIPLVANEAQELSNIDTALVIEAFEKPIENLEVWYDKMNIGGNDALSLREELQEGLASVLNINVISDLIATAASILGNFAWALFAISFITFFLLREEKLITSYIVTIVPEKKVEAFQHALESTKQLLRRYFVGILLQMTGILTLVTVGMTIDCGSGFQTWPGHRTGGSCPEYYSLPGTVDRSRRWNYPWSSRQSGSRFCHATTTPYGLYNPGVCHHSNNR